VNVTAVSDAVTEYDKFSTRQALSNPTPDKLVPLALSYDRTLQLPEPSERTVIVSPAAVAMFAAVGRISEVAL
jgi:hypothetical protein